MSLKHFLDFNASVLAIHLKFNSCSVILPERITKCSLVNNTFDMIRKDDFNISAVFGSNPKHFDILTYDRDNLMSNFETPVTDRDVYLFISSNKHLVLLKAINEMNGLFANICAALCGQDAKPIFDYGSLTAAGFQLFKSHLEDNVAIISHEPKQFNKNISTVSYTHLTLPTKA